MTRARPKHAASLHPPLLTLTLTLALTCASVRHVERTVRLYVEEAHKTLKHTWTSARAGAPKGKGPYQVSARFFPLPQQELYLWKFKGQTLAAE